MIIPVILICMMVALVTVFCFAKRPKKQQEKVYSDDRRRASKVRAVHALRACEENRC